MAWSVSVASVTAFVAQLASQCARCAASCANQCGGEGALRGIAHLRGDLADWQAGVVQQRLGMLQAALAYVFHRRSARLAKKARVQTGHRQPGDTGQVGNLKRVG